VIRRQECKREGKKRRKKKDGQAGDEGESPVNPYYPALPSSVSRAGIVKRKRGERKGKKKKREGRNELKGSSLQPAPLLIFPTKKGREGEGGKERR